MRSYLLAVVAILVTTVPPSIRGDCAAPSSKCNCRTEYGYDKVYCEDLGSISRVPSFTQSSVTYFMLKIMGTTTLPNIQTGAFNGVKLKRLYLVKIGVTTLQADAFSDLSDTLEELYLHENAIDTIADTAFNGLHKLRDLSLRNNHLNVVSSVWFKQLSALLNLELNDNYIETIADGFFNGIKQIGQLDLSNNRLKIVSAAWFHKMTALSSLYLAGNQIETIQEDTFHGLHQLRELKLSDNPFVCDCNLSWVRKLTEILNDVPLCASPPAVKNTRVIFYDISLCTATTSEPGNVCVNV